MAVRKIRKISSTVLLVISLLTIVVLAVYIFGGYVDPAAAKPVPKYVDLLMYTCYAVFGLTLLTMIIFSIWGFIGKFKTNPKGALTGLGAIISIIVLLGVTYVLGSTNKLKLNADLEKYNDPFWLKFTDMWLYSIYFMLLLCIVALLWGAVRNIVVKRN